MRLWDLILTSAGGQKLSRSLRKNFAKMNLLRITIKFFSGEFANGNYCS